MGVSANTVVKPWEKPKRFPYGSSTARPSPAKKSQPHDKWDVTDQRPTRSRSVRQVQSRRAKVRTARARAAHGGGSPR
ncbi:MAG TPA: hypothetical protein VGP33_04930 [Chloroflexota bacterium]|nr:hypothetical protein [Chloroflexota bacterium]